MATKISSIHNTQARSPVRNSRTEEMHSTASRCYSKLRDLLVYGQLPPGVRLAELEWSERFGAHRGALREAMAMLAQQSLLARGEKGGFFVPILDAKAREEICQTRMFLEGGAIQLIGMQKLNQKTLLPLKKICDTMQHMFDAEMFLGFVEADRKFHEKLVELAGNTRLSTLYRLAPLPVGMPLTMDSEIAKQDKLKKRLEEHQAIYQALAEHRTDDAIRALEQHLNLDGMRLSPNFERAMADANAQQASTAEE